MHGFVYILYKKPVNLCFPVFCKLLKKLIKPEEGVLGTLTYTWLF
jgi:hypothetical protein